MTNVFVVSEHSLSSIESKPLAILEKQPRLNQKGLDYHPLQPLAVIPPNAANVNEPKRRNSVPTTDNENHHKNPKFKTKKRATVDIAAVAESVPKNRKNTQKKVAFADDAISIIDIPTNTESQKHNKQTFVENPTSVTKATKDGVNEEQQDLDTSLQSEKILYEEVARKRLETFNSILFDEPIIFDWKKMFLYTFGIIIISVSSTIPYSLIPAHDLVLSPEYWYEVLFHATYGSIWGSCLNSFKASYFLNIRQIQYIHNISRMFLIECLLLLFFLISSHQVWTKILSYQYPIPFLGFVMTYSFTMIFCLIIWLHFSDDWRQDTEFQKRMKNYALYWCLSLTICSVYMAIADILRQYPNQYQPIMALSLTLTREVFLRFGNKLIKNTASGDERGAYIIHKYAVCVAHTIILCIVIGSYITITTMWFLMGLDFGINIILCLKVVWLKRRNLGSIRNQINILQDLAINELVEFHATLSFILVFSIAYYGPNAHLFGNISNSYWTYIAIEDITQTLGNMILFFLVDFSSVIISAVILWYFCNINLLKVFLALLEEFGNGFCIIIVSSLTLVSQPFIIIIWTNH